MSAGAGDSRPREGDDLLLDVLGGEAHAVATGGGDDLEIDDQQANEIRQIVLTTLPQYLLPVEQMAAQLFDSYEEQLKAALLTTVDSVAQATERIGVHDVSAPLDRLRKVVTHLDEQSSQDPDVQHRVRDLIVEIKLVAAGEQASEPAASEATTLVEAFRGLKGVSAGILEKLTTAGLVTLDQLWMADPGEIVAVSGLDSDVVAHLLAALAERHGRPWKHKSPVPARPAPEPADDRLEEAIREQVETEALIDQKRAEVLRVRLDLRNLRDELAGAQEKSASLSSRLAATRERVAAGLARVASLQTEEAALKKRLEAARAAIVTNESRLVELQRVRDSVTHDFESLTTGLASIRERVTTLMRDAEQTEQESSSGWIEHGTSE